MYVPSGVFTQILAEEVRFELTEVISASPVFETGAFNLSATLPNSGYGLGNQTQLGAGQNRSSSQTAAIVLEEG